MHRFERLRHAGLALRVPAAGRSSFAETVDVAALPLLPGVEPLLARGVRSTFHAENARLRARIAGAVRVEAEIVFDPQTSGGLLVACARDAADEVLSLFRAEGFERAAVIGEIGAGAPRLALR